MVADFSITSFSPCINTGTSALGGVVLPATDIGFNPRVNNGIIDRGAYENQQGIPQFILQPAGVSVCEDDTVAIAISTADTAIY